MLKTLFCTLGWRGANATIIKLYRQVLRLGFNQFRALVQAFKVLRTSVPDLLRKIPLDIVFHTLVVTFIWRSP